MAGLGEKGEACGANVAEIGEVGEGLVAEGGVGLDESLFRVEAEDAALRITLAIAEANSGLDRRRRPIGERAPGAVAAGGDAAAHVEVGRGAFLHVEVHLEAKAAIAQRFA